MPELSETIYNIPFSFRFKVEFTIKGNPTGTNDNRFQEVSGINSELAIETLEEGGENRFTHRLPGRAKYENLVLKRGMLSDSKLIKWFQDAVEELVFEKAEVTVHLINDSNTTIESWTFYNVWPVKWSVSEFKAQENALVIETIELAYSYFKRNK